MADPCPIWGSLTGMATGYKAMSVEILRGLSIQSLRFELNSEVTAKLLAVGRLMKEMPVSCRPRSPSENKKIKWEDSSTILWSLLRWSMKLPVRSLSPWSAAVCVLWIVAAWVLYLWPHLAQIREVLPRYFGG